MKEYLIIGIDDDEQFLSSLEASLPDKVSRLCEQFQCRFEFVSRPKELYTVIAGSKEAQPALLISDHEWKYVAEMVLDLDPTRD